jgi:hypothetical protein
VFSWSQKSGGPGAAVRCGDCCIRMPSTGAAGLGCHSGVNGWGTLPPPPGPTHFAMCRLLPSQRTCGGLEPMRSVRHHAERGSPTAAVYTLRSDGLDYDSRETL